MFLSVARAVVGATVAEVVGEVRKVVAMISTTTVFVCSSDGPPLWV